MKIAHNYIEKIAVVTGGSGALGGAMAQGLALEGMKVILMGRTQSKLNEQADKICSLGGQAIGITADVLSQDSLTEAKNHILDQYGRIDLLVNAAGGNVKGAVIQPDESVFDLNMADFDQVVDLNLKGSLLPTLIFGKEIAKHPHGNIVNISSIAAQQTLTRVLGYSASKAAIENTTKWLAVEFAQKYEHPIRVNAIAPGFFIGEQNKNLLLNEDGSLTDRGSTIIQNTPMGRFGKPEELITSLLYLVSEASSFITGTVLYVDGGFKAFSGV